MRAFVSRIAFLFAAVIATALLAGSGAAQAATKLKAVLLVEAIANDGSFNQAAVNALKKLAAAGEIEYEVREKLADPTAAEPVIRLYASRGYDLIIGHGIGLSAPILKVAKDFPKTHFTASAGPDLADRLQPNVDGWTYDFGQYGYLGGWLAGQIAGVDTVGVVGGPQLPFILATHAGFKAGLASVKPKAKTVEVFTGSFDDAQKGLEATRSVAAQGAQLVWTSGDGIGNGVAAGANAVGLRTIGVSGDAGGLAAKVNIASVELNLVPLYTDWLNQVREGKFGHQFTTVQLSNNGLVLTPLNHLGEGIPADLEKAQAKLVEDLKSGALTLPNFFTN
ncbi:Basic membrane lipoprotein [Mesorhizobium plurifarium]|uniref:Basic membrane lipoprotein n=1 Tax=Mesorhizobium plurifarium TaxID=69974 RepID=A0A0K2VQG3_MESPL|nr:Basic membrane lipoprotein [Mesorhizobium plurifarium]